MIKSNGYAAYANSKVATATPAELTVAKDFDAVYKYLKERLVEANVKKDKEVLEEVLEHLRTMRDTWKEIMKVAHA